MLPPTPVSTLVFYVNGRKIEENNVSPKWTLLEYLRNKLRLCGTKLGCGEGGCGACTVMISKYDRQEAKIHHLSINACLTAICSVHGLAVTTVEGIGSTKTRLHPVQERLYKAHGSQCGFCTPGIVMSMYTLLRNNPQPPMEEIENYFQGNLCRCTGYRPILEGCKSFTPEGGCCNGSAKCCQNGSLNFEDDNNNEPKDTTRHLFDPLEFAPYDPSQEPIFPSELQISDKYDKQFLMFRNDEMTWYRPLNLQTFLELKASHPEAKISAGNTEIGVETKFKNCHYPTILSPSEIPELHAISQDENGITFGASTTLSRLEEVLKESVEKEPEYKTRVFAAILEMLQLFAGKQIRNVASIAGNITTASPISDLNPLLLAARARLQIASRKGARSVEMNDTFFTGYRKTSMKEDEILLSVTIPYTSRDEYFCGFKQSQRREDDIAIVNAGMRVRFTPEAPHLTEEICLAFGGMAPTTVSAHATVKQLVGKPWNDHLMTDACRLLLEDLPLQLDAPGGMVKFRRTLAISFFFKFYLKILSAIHQEKTEISHFGVIPNRYKSAAASLIRDHPKASQCYQIVAPGQRANDPVGRPVLHQSGALHTTGEAIYCDDIPQVQGELHMAFVTSDRAHARIVSIDATPALELDGVQAFFSAKDLSADKNLAGLIERDWKYFATEEVFYVGQIIGAIVAEDKALAQKAAKRVKVEMKDVEPIILTLEDAIAANSYFERCTHEVKGGDLDQGFAEADHVLEGEMRIGGQQHFYLETHSAQATPVGEHDELVLTVSTQAPILIQNTVTKALGLPASKIVVKTKRIGGGFGGKTIQTTYFAVPLALAASKLQRPVRFMLDRDEDFVISGGRHPFLIKYKVGFKNDGSLTVLSANAYSNAGAMADVSPLVMTEFLEKFDSAYNIPNIHVIGRLCKTHLPPNTAFRGFGAPQAMLFIQHIVRDVAHYLRLKPERVQDLNLYVEGDHTFYGQELNYCTVRKCWTECLRQSDYERRDRDVQQFNKENRWRKRGLSIIPMKYGVGFGRKALNQGAALVHIYTDGSVLVSHGGVEMGQGLHTKILQVASRVLGIPLDNVHLSETSTDKVPNATQTAGSFATDIFAPAVQNACQTLVERLEPYMRAQPKASWEEWVRAAYADRVSLSSTGFHKVSLNDKNLFHYFSYGAACSEVEIDCLTGDHQVLRTDIVMDVGESLNPGIDIGQIEGAFVQGYGLYTLEELRYSPRGFLYTRGPGTYKIPGFGDIPNEFHVSLLQGSPNKLAIYSSKAVGEPPLLLASSVFFAIKAAIASARAERKLDGLFRLDSPATAEKIRMACADRFTQQVDETQEEKSYCPWSVTV